MAKPKKATGKRKQSVKRAESTSLDLVDKALELVKELDQSKAGRHFKIVDAGLEEEVIAMLLGGWTCVGIADRLHRQYGADISRMAVSRFAHVAVAPVLGMSQAERDRITEALSSLDVLGELKMLAEQGRAVCLDARKLEENLEMPLDIAIQARRQYKELLLAYYQTETEELGLTKLTSVQLNQLNLMNQTNASRTDIEEMTDEQLDDYLARLEEVQGERQPSNRNPGEEKTADTESLSE